MSIELSILTPNVPSICHEELAPDFQKEMIAAMKAVSKQIDHIRPDVIVVVSSRWESSFCHYVDCTPEHNGILTASEVPDVIKDLSYYYPGDLELAGRLVKAGVEAGLPVKGVNDPYLLWDYGTVVPLRYLVPKDDIPVINLSVTLTANLEETYRWGQVIARTFAQSEKRAVFVASGALSHHIVRGLQQKPTVPEQAMNRQFLEFLKRKEYEAAFDMLKQYASLAKVDSGGRHLALFLSILETGSEPAFLAEGQSSGSWNAVVTFEKKIKSSWFRDAISEYANE